MMKPTLPQKSWETALAPSTTLGSGHDHPISAIAGALVVRVDGPKSVLNDRPTAAKRDNATRRKIWDLDHSLHCSVIGTCLTTGELRALIGKFHEALGGRPSDHELHTIAVAAVGKRNMLAKQIEKALDRRHATAIRHFGSAKNVDELRQLWREARQAGEIPGSYWAVLIHPQASDALVREAFGDVHMLSHLVGAANRADIRRLHQLEEEKAALEEKSARQQAHLRDAVLSRDTKIRELGDALSAQIERNRLASQASQSASASEIATLLGLVADLRKLLDLEIRRHARAEQRAAELTSTNGRIERARLALEEEVAILQAELEAIESGIASATSEGEAKDTFDLRGLTILYVGGRPQQIAQLRLLIERAGGQLVHHDGGIEDRADLIAGLVSRASAAFFPVDCISHRAALMLKRLCQQTGKPYLPLRSSGIASMLRALRDSGLAGPARSAAE